MSDIELTGKQIQVFQEALLSAFPNESILSRMLKIQLEITLEEHAKGKDMSDTCFRIIEWAHANGRMSELIRKAHVFNPGNDKLFEFAEQFSFQVPFLKGYRYDIFISHADEIDTIWLNGLKGGLKKLLMRQLKESIAIATSNLKSQNLSNSTNQNNGILDLTGVLIVVLSHGSSKSEHCKTEYADFIAGLQGSSDAPKRIFVVENQQLSRDKWPTYLTHYRPYRYWGDSESASVNLVDLGKELCNSLKEIANYRDNLSSNIDGTSNNDPISIERKIDPKPDRSDFKSQEISKLYKAVFLAEVTPDLDSAREEVQRYLKQKNIIVLPDEWYPRDPKMFAEALDRDLGGCSLFVQLLGGAAERTTADLPRGYTGLQYERAIVSGRPIIQWRSSSLNIDDVSSKVHRALLEAPTVRAESIESFKQAVLAAATTKHTNANSQQNLALRGFQSVFISAEAGDRHWIDNEICSPVTNKGLVCILSRHEGDPSEVHKFMEVGVKGCDVLLIVYGSSQQSWVLNQLLECNKILADRERPLKALALYDGPPLLKDDFSIRMPSLQLLQCRADTSAFIGFLESL